MRFLLLLTFAAACSQPRAPLASHPRGYATRMTDAEVHQERADRHTAAAAEAERTDTGLDRQNNYVCGDTAMPGLNDHLTSGGERLVPTVPCWDVTEENARHHRAYAAREQRIARTERRDATALVEDELAECRGISARELEHSPFAHTREIATVVPHRDAGRIRGARIVFRPVPGLTAMWLRQAIACHRARFERLGQPPGYLPDDPTLVAGTTATVAQRNGHLEVLVEGGDDLSARAALDRAQDLVRSRTRAASR